MPYAVVDAGDLEGRRKPIRRVLRPGRYVLVTPEATRQVVAGADGLSYTVVGVRPGCYPDAG